jgi:hypothetical protein
LAKEAGTIAQSVVQVLGVLHDAELGGEAGA